MSEINKEIIEGVVSVETARELPFDRIIPNDLPLLFSDNIAVKQQDGMFLIYFFQNQQPLSFSEEELKNIQKIETVCVARVLLTPAQFAKLVSVMSTLFDTHLSKLGIEPTKEKN